MALACSATGAIPGACGAVFGTSGRDEFRGPDLFNLDMSLAHTFPIHEQMNLVLELQAYSITNTPHFTNPRAIATTTVGKPGTFGQITGTYSGTSFGVPRSAPARGNCGSRLGSRSSLSHITTPTTGVLLLIRGARQFSFPLLIESRKSPAHPVAHMFLKECTHRTLRAAPCKLGCSCGLNLRLIAAYALGAM